MAPPTITLRDTLDEVGRIAQLLEPTFGKLPSQIEIKNANDVKMSWTIKEKDIQITMAIDEVSALGESLCIQHCKDFYIFSINIINLPF